MVRKLLRLFYEVFKISLFVLGGGYAILVVANEVFGKRLKWLKEGELIDHLPIFQMVPGLIAGNTAIYVGLKTVGRIGAVVALLAVALPSFLIFLAVSYGYDFLPTDNACVNAALAGLRAAITGIVFATLLRGFKKGVVGIYGYASFIAASALLVLVNVNVLWVLLGAMAIGVTWVFSGGKTPANDSAGNELNLAPLTKWQKAFSAIAFILFIAAVLVVDANIFGIFLKFGCLGFGGGYALVPLYIHEFVGESARYLQLATEEFANLMALTQMTPGPISINAATFFGYRMDGIVGAAISTMSLLLPSLVLLTALLTGLSRWRENKVVKGILFGVKPAASALILKAAVEFSMMSVFVRTAGEGVKFSALSAMISCVSCYMLLKTKISVMLIILFSALIALAVSLIG